MKQFNDFKLVLSVTTKSFLDRLSLLIKIFIGFLMVQVGYAGVNYLMMKLWIQIGSAGIILGIVIAILQAACFSMMIYFLYQAVLYKRIGLSFQEIKSSFTIFIGDVYFIMFLRWIFSMLLGVLLSNPVISFALIIIFSALPETIYLGNSHREGLLLESINFLKNNWYFWIPLTFIGYVMQRVVFEQELLLNWYSFFGDSMNLIKSILYIAFSSIFYLYRGIVFQYLNNSNPRKRKFMQNF